MSKEEAMTYFEKQEPRCPDCGLKLSREKDSFICWICQNKFVCAENHRIEKGGK